MHWTTDVLSGWFYGILLLSLFILATLVIMGPARTPEEVAAGAPDTYLPDRGAKRGKARCDAGKSVSSDREQWPLVSVIVPTRGLRDLVRATISSIVSQAYPGRIECLVVADQEPPDLALAALGTAEHQVRGDSQ